MKDMLQNVTEILTLCACYNLFVAPVRWMVNLSEDLVLALLRSDKEYPIDFDDAWQWLEFSRKDSAKRSFENSGFLAKSDFCSFHTNVERAIGSSQKEKIYLTIDCFKTWAMMVNTDKGKEVRRRVLTLRQMRL